MEIRSLDKFLQKSKGCLSVGSMIWTVLQVNNVCTCSYSYANQYAMRFIGFTDPMSSLDQ